VAAIPRDAPEESLRGQAAPAPAEPEAQEPALIRLIDDPYPALLAVDLDHGLVYEEASNPPGQKEPLQRAGP